MRRFKGKLVKMIKDAGDKFDDYSISPKIRQILLHWCYEFTEKDLLRLCGLKIYFFFTQYTNKLLPL